MLKQKTVEIQGTTYMMTMFPYEKGIVLLNKLRPIIGRVFSEYYDTATNNQILIDAVKDGMEVNFKDIRNIESAVIVALNSELDKVDSPALIKELLNSVTKDNMNLNFNDEFAGTYDKALLLVWEVIQFNFGSVFSLAGTRAPQ